MTETITSYLLKDLDAEWLAGFSKDRGEPAWLGALRRKAFDAYLALPWPDKKSDLWKRTELKSLKWDQLRFVPTAQSALADLTALPDALSGLNDDTQANGHTPAQTFWDLGKGLFRSVPPALAQHGVEWLSLEDAVRHDDGRLRKAWSDAVERATDNKFLLLTLAVGNGGLVLSVPKNKKIDLPFHQNILAGGELQAQFPLNFIFVGDGSEVQVWEELAGTPATPDADKPTFVSSYLGVEVAANAQASFYFLQHWNANTIHFRFQHVAQRAHSRLNTVAVGVGGRVTHGDTIIDLAGDGAENKVLGVLFGDGKQNFENWITQNHVGKRTTSDIQFRGALTGAAKSFFSGLVSIVKEAQQSDAFQSSKTLLLSSGARADAIPNLEILADDVKCSHGAAAGPVDPDQKYYLQTRGVPADEAESIIIQGFFEPVIASVPNENVQERLRTFIEEKIQK